MTLTITFPDGAKKEFAVGITTKEIAEGISKSLAKKALAGKVNGQLIDLDRGIEEDAQIEIVTPDHEDALGLVRHSAAHLMAQAMRRLYPNIHFGVGPAIDTGFYYDTDNGESPVTAEDLPAIEAEMMKIVKENLPIERRVLSKKEALELFAEDPYKVELISELPEMKRLLPINKESLLIYAAGLTCHQQDGFKCSNFYLWQELTGVEIQITKSCNGSMEQRSLTKKS